MLGFDKRLLARGTRFWVTVSAVTGLLIVVTNIALFTSVGWVVEGLWRSEEIFTAPTTTVALMLILAKATLGWLERFAAAQAAQETKLAVRATIYAHALRLGPSGLDRERTGDLINTAVDGMDWLELYFGVYWAQFIVGMATPVLVIGYIALWDSWSALVLLGALFLPPLLLGATSQRFKAVSERYFAVSNHLSAQFLDYLQGMSTLKMFNQGATYGERWRQENETLRRETMRLLAVNQMMLFFVDGGFALATTTTLTLLSLWRFSVGALSPGMAITFVLLSVELARPLNLIGQFFFAGAIGRSVAKKVSAFLDTPPIVSESSEGRRLNGTPEIRFENVTFQYASRDLAALKDVSLSIRPGEQVALVGTSGAGKSTIFQVLLGFFTPQQGEILLNGVPLSRYSLASLREHIAFVPQDPYLFYGTLEENLRVAKPDATEAELQDAVRAAHLDEDIARLPAGLQTMIGERGLTLSGGQAQRLALARAFLKNAPILLLDEPTAHLDGHTEAAVRDSIERLRAGRTVIMIAHRLSTARRADRILVMDDGCIIESGTPSELMAQNGVFAQMMTVAGRGAL